MDAEPVSSTAFVLRTAKALDTRISYSPMSRVALYSAIWCCVPVTPREGCSALVPLVAEEPPVHLRGLQGGGVTLHPGGDVYAALEHGTEVGPEAGLEIARVRPHHGDRPVQVVPHVGCEA